jgi:hypothetical protein
MFAELSGKSGKLSLKNPLFTSRVHSPQLYQKTLQKSLPHPPQKKNQKHSLVSHFLLLGVGPLIHTFTKKKLHEVKCKYVWYLFATIIKGHWRPVQSRYIFKKDKYLIRRTNYPYNGAHALRVIRATLASCAIVWDSLP